MSVHLLDDHNGRHRAPAPARRPSPWTRFRAWLAAPVTVAVQPQRPANGRTLGTLPRRKPLVNRPPWGTAPQAAIKPGSWE